MIALDNSLNTEIFLGLLQDLLVFLNNGSIMEEMRQMHFYLKLFRVHPYSFMFILIIIILVLK